MKKVVVLGANGYIARNLIFVLQRDYPDVEVCPYGVEPESVDGYNNYLTVDMTNRESIRNIDLACDVIYMFVGRTGSINGFEEYDSFIDINEKALLNLLSEYRVQKSTARIVFPSTRLVYKGNSGKLKEDSEKEFKTVYAINKYACEQYLEQFHKVFNIQYSIFRICVPYGTLIPNTSSYGTAEFMLDKATKGENISLYGDGSVRRTLTYMGDLCKILIEGASSENCVNTVLNVGGEDYSLKEMATLIAKKYSVGIEYVPWPEDALKIESGDTVFDSQKIEGAIGCFTTSKFSNWVK